MPRDRDDLESVIPEIVHLLEQRAPRPLSIPDMARALGAEHYDLKQLKAGLERHVAAKRLRRIGKTRYQFRRDMEPVRRGARTARTAVRQAAPIAGVFSRVRAGYGFVQVLGPDAAHFARDILIPEGSDGDAMHGDRVAVEITRRDRHTQRTVGRITAVTERAHAYVIGALECRADRWRIIPENDLLPVVNILGASAPGATLLGAADRDKIALVRVTQPPAAGRPAGGIVERILGEPDDPQVQFLSIAFAHSLRIEFPAGVVTEVGALPGDPSPADFAGREDLRHAPFVTIDGETARDFDDAVWVEAARSGGYRLRVAIADVSHYVQPRSALDEEAACRGTSVYFPDRAIPMLPDALSNGLCSLNPGRDRLVLVADLAYDRTGTRHQARFYRAVIRSQARLTYTKVAAVLSSADSMHIRQWRAELEHLIPQLRLMYTLMRQLCSARLRAGSLDLDLPEALVDLSEEGRSIGLRFAPRNDAHRIIEELMLEANQAVAELLRDQQIPLPYRVHEPPDPADIDDLNEMLGAFGLRVHYEDQVQPRDVQRLLTDLDGHRLSTVLSRFVLRALKQAQYSTHNVGHFGLAFPIYCHFTSPIRRYPDLLVHRQLGRVFDHGLEGARAAADALEGASLACSQRERQAMEAERAMLDLKKAEFMLAHLLEPQPGTVVSVVKFGLFVALDAYPVEGLLRIDDLPGDRYYFLEAERALKGARTRQRFRLGDRVLVEATNASVRTRQVDLALLQRLPHLSGHGDPSERRGKTPRARKQRR